MKKNRIIGFAGLFILLLSGFCSLASINGIPVTILPLFDNFSIGGEIWLWRNISAFAMTHYLALIIGIILLLKNHRIGTIIVGVIFLINTFFILIAVWMSHLEADIYNDIVFAFEWGWLMILFGCGLFLYSGIKIKKV